MGVGNLTNPDPNSRVWSLHFVSEPVSVFRSGEFPNLGRAGGWPDLRNRAISRMPYVYQKRKIMHKTLRIGSSTLVVALVAWLSLIGGRVAASAPVDSRGLAASQDPVVLGLDVSKHVFYEGEPILIRITAVNRSSQAVAVLQNSPWEAAILVITEGGRTVIPSNGASGVRNRNPIFAPLQPGQNWIYQSYSDPQHYYALSNWGYNQLPPGHYTIVASPEITSVHVRSGRWTPIHKQNRSNTVEIEIRP